MMKNSKITTFARLGSEINKILTSFFMDGIELIPLSGLKALNALIPWSDLVFALIGRNSNMAERTTIKSKKFHPSLKYEFFSSMNPKATIFKAHSMMKIALKQVPK